MTKKKQTKPRAKKAKDGLHYSYEASKSFCEQIGLFWLGDDFVKQADAEAFLLKFTQAQVDAAMKHHLWQVKFLFDPKTYDWKHRFLLAAHFLFGGKK